jgi:hypothetical protein
MHTRVMGEMMGKVIFQNESHAVAPSMEHTS